MISKLQYISQGKTALEQEVNIRTALDHGAEWIQVRWKNATNADKLLLSEQILSLCRSYKATCIINDSVFIAKTIDADGVHLGLKDESITTARATLGDSKIIGGSANTFADIMQRKNENCDYIGLGPFRFTTTKENLSPLLGLEGYRSLFSKLTEENISIPPAFAIGGITLPDIEDIVDIGFFGIALSSLLTAQPELVTTIKTKLL